MNKSYFTCPRCGTNHDCDPHGSRWFEPIESSGEEEKTTLYPGRRWDELSREQQAQFLKDCEEGARNARLGPCDRPDAGIGQYAGFSAPDIKPGVNIGPLSGPDAISAKEAEEAMDFIGRAEGADAEEHALLQAALAVIKAALRPKVVTREWVLLKSAELLGQLFVRVHPTVDAITKKWINDLLHEKGIGVEEKP